MPLSHNMDNTARYTLATLTGIVMPTADPRALRATAELYETTGTQITHHLTDLLTHIRRRVRTDFSGQAADYFDRSVAQFTTGDNDYIGAAGQIAADMGRELRKAAANAEYMAMMVIGQLVQLLLEIAWAIASAYWTFGASLKMIPVFKAIRSLLIRRILSWFLLTVPGHQIISQIFASLDSIIQRIQIANGTRTEWDHDLTTSAHLGAVIEGLLSAGLSGGVDLLLNGPVNKLINQNLLDLKDLPDPPPITTPRQDPVPDDAPSVTNPRPDPEPDPPASGLNDDLTDLFTRHNDELTVPYKQGDVPGIGSWPNTANRDQLRQDFADLFERRFADELGSSAARNLGNDYADAFARNWPSDDLSTHLSRALGDSLPPAVRDHLADTVPDTLSKGLRDINSGAGPYARNLGLGASTGALEGYLGEGLSNTALQGEWKASGFSASAGASNATTQTVVTDASVKGIDSLRGGPNLPPPLTAPPPTSTGNPSASASDDALTDGGATDDTSRDGSDRGSGHDSDSDRRGSGDDRGSVDTSASGDPGRGDDRDSVTNGGTRNRGGNETDDTSAGTGRSDEGRGSRDDGATGTRDTGVAGDAGDRRGEDADRGPADDSGAVRRDDTTGTRGSGEAQVSVPGDAPTSVEAPPGDNPYLSPFTSELTTDSASNPAPGAADQPTPVDTDTPVRADVDQDSPSRAPDDTATSPTSGTPARSGGEEAAPDSDTDVDWPLADLYDSTDTSHTDDDATSFAPPPSPFDLSSLLNPKGSFLTPDLSVLDPKAGLGLPQSPLPWMVDDLQVLAVHEITVDPAAETTDDENAPSVTHATTIPTPAPGSHQGSTTQQPTTPQDTTRQHPTRSAPAEGQRQQSNQPSSTAVPTTSLDGNVQHTSDTAPPPVASANPTTSDHTPSPPNPLPQTSTHQAPPPVDTTRGHDEAAPSHTHPTGEAPPPPPGRTEYAGSFTPDRSGDTYRLDYLTASTLVGPHMAAAENVDTFVGDTLRGVDGLAAPDRRRIMDAFEEVFRAHGPRPFLAPGGHTVEVQGPNGTWTAALSLNPSDGDFRHVPTRPLGDGTETRFLRTQNAGIGVNSHDSGSRAGNKSVGGKFTASPVYVADIGVARAGPLASLGGRFGTGVRGTDHGASNSANSDTEIWQLAPPELYAADLDMDLTVTPPAAPPVSGTQAGGPAPAPVPHTSSGRSGNGLVLNLPGEVVAHPDMPQSIRLHTGPTPAPGQPPRAAVHHPGVGHPISVGRIVPVDPGSNGDGTGGRTDGPGATDLGPWIADHMLVDPDTSVSQWVSEHLPGGSDRRRQRLDDFRASIERAFHPDQIQNLLPQITNTPSNIRVSAPDGSQRIMKLWSVPTSYTRKDHSPPLVDLLRNNTSTKGTSSSVNRSSGITGTVGGGFGLHIDLPGDRSIRLDAPFVEYAFSVGSNTSDTRSQSATSSTFTHGHPRYGAYDVERDYYVRFEGESETHHFHGRSVDILNAEDAQALRHQVNATDDRTETAPDASGERGGAAPTRKPDDENGGRARDTGEEATPAQDTGDQSATPARGTVGGTGSPAKVPPFPNLRGDRVTDLSGADIRTFGWPPTTADTSNTAADASASPGGRSVHEELGHQILTGIAQERPGLVIPELARDRGNYAHRPGNTDAPYFDRSPREHTGLRRDQDVARENTMRILDAVSESSLKSNSGDLTRDGIPVRLTEPAGIDLPSTVKGKELTRPDTVTVRITAGIGPLRHRTESESSSGTRVNGASGLSRASNRSRTHAVTTSVGMNVREDAGADARGVPAKFGTPSASVTRSSGISHGTGQGITHSTEDRVMLSGGNDVWTADTRFDARLHEHDDLGQVRDGRPIRERGIPLLGAGLDTRTTLTTPKVQSPPTRSGPPPLPAPPTALSSDQARDIIRRGFVPDQPVAGPSVTSSARTGPPSLAEHRAKEIIKHGGTIERVNTDLGGGPNRPGLVEQTYGAFGTARDSRFHHGYSRKLEHLLTDTPSSRPQFENRLSGESLATDPSAASPAGARTRQDMSGGFLSPHDVRATIATQVNVDAITDFLPVSAQIWWSGGTQVNLSTSDSRSTSWSARLGSGATDNPNRAGTDDSLPSEAIRPIPVGGPSFGFTPYSVNRSTSHQHGFSSSVLFIPQVARSYAFRGSGDITQAIEFKKNWSIGPTLPWNIRYRGWRVPVQNLVSGYVHAHDAHNSNLVQDAVSDSDDGPVLGSQPNPKKPSGLSVRPGFENTGRQMRPADPNAAIQSLVDHLAGDGLELTGNSREQLLHTLTTQLGNNPAKSAPVPVRVRPIGQPVHTSTDAKVYVDLSTTGTRTEYVGFAGDYIESRTWTDTDGHGEGRGTSRSTGADVTLLQPTGYQGDQSGPEDQPGSRPLFVAPNAGVNTGSGESTSRGASDSANHTVEIQMHVPYAKITQDTELTLTLELGTPATDTSESRDGSDSGGGSRRTTFTGRGDGGEIETLFPFSYLALAPPPSTDTATDGAVTDHSVPKAGPSRTHGRDGAADTDAQGTTAPRTDAQRDQGREQGQDREQNQGHQDPPAPEHPVSTPYASLNDMMRTWAANTRNAAPGSVPASDDIVILPIALEDHGKAVRDTAAVVLAKSLGWTPPADAVRDGAYTPQAINDARSHVADELKLDPRSNAIDHALGDVALQALYPGASRNDDGVRLLSIGRTDWSVKALPDLSHPTILDVVPGTRISDNLTHGGADGRNRGRSSTTGGSADVLRPVGLSTEAAHDYDGHEGIYTGGAPGHASSRTDGSSHGSDQPVKRYPRSDRLRQGPAYLVEFDTTWAVGAASKLPRSTSWMNKVRGTGAETGPSGNRPARWQLGDTSTRLSGWVSEADAIEMGVITRAQADQLRPSFDALHEARQAFADAEKAYADARGPLEQLADEAVNGTDADAARQRYDAQKAGYDQALTEFNAGIDRWTATLDRTRKLVEDPRDITVPAPRDGKGKGKAHVRALPTITESAEPVDTTGIGPRGGGPLADTFRSLLNVEPGSRQHRSPGTQDDLSPERRAEAERASDESRRLQKLSADLRAEARDLRSALPNVLEQERRAEADVARLERDVQRLEERDLPPAREERDTAELKRAQLKPQVTRAHEAADAAATAARDAAGTAAALGTQHAEQRSAADDARTRAEQARYAAETAELAQTVRELRDRIRSLETAAQDAHDEHGRAVEKARAERDRYDTRQEEGVEDAANADSVSAWPQEATRPDRSARDLQDAADRAREVSEAAARNLADTRAELDRRTAELALRQGGDTGTEDTVQELRERADDLRTSATRAEEAAASAQTRADELRDLLDTAEKNAESAAGHAAGLQEKARGLDTRLGGAERDLTAAQQKLDALAQQLRTAESGLAASRTALNDARDEATRIRTDAEGLEQRAERARQDADRLSERWERLLDPSTEWDPHDSGSGPRIPDGSEQAAGDGAGPNAGNVGPRTGPPRADVSHLTHPIVMSAFTPNPDGPSGSTETTGHGDASGSSAGRSEPARGWPPPPAWGGGRGPEGMPGARTFDTYEGSATYLTRRMPPPALNGTESAYVRYYTAEGSYVINSELRSGVTQERATPSMRDAVRNLDGALDRSRAPEPILLYRSVDTLPAQLDASPNSVDGMVSLVGRTFNDPGYGSAAMAHQPLYPERRIQLSIRVPQGYPALNVMDVPGVTNRNEHEVMIRRDATYLVHDVTRLPDDQYGLKTWSVDVEIVPDGWTPPTESADDSTDDSNDRDDRSGGSGGSARGTGGGAGPGGGPGQGAPPPPDTRHDGTGRSLRDAAPAQSDDAFPSLDGLSPPFTPNLPFGPKSSPWPFDLDPKRPYDPNVLPDLPFPEYVPTTSTTEEHPATETPDQAATSRHVERDARGQEATDRSPTTGTSPSRSASAWPPPPAWGEGAHPQGMRDGQTLDGHDQGTIYLSLLMQPPAMTGAEAAVVRDVAGGGGETAVNDALRNGTPPEHAPARTREAVDTLDALIDRSTTPDPLILHHRADTGFAERLGVSPADPDTMRALIGRTYTDPGYVAATTGEQPLDFRHPIDVIVKVPQGHPALNTAGRRPGDGPDVVLRRGSTFVVHDVRHVLDDLYDNDHWVVEAEIVPDGWTPPPEWRTVPRDGEGGLPPAPAPATETGGGNQAPPLARPHPATTDDLMVMSAFTPRPGPWHTGHDTDSDDTSDMGDDADDGSSEDSGDGEVLTGDDDVRHDLDPAPVWHGGPHEPGGVGMAHALRFADDDEAAHWADTHLPRVSDPASAEAVSDYTGADYTLAHAGLRHGNVGVYRRDDFTSLVRGVDRAIADSPLPVPLIVHKGVDSAFTDNLGIDLNDPATLTGLVGTVHTEPSYVSTSVGSRTPYDRPLYLMFRVPQGFPGLNAAPLSHASGEREILIPRNSSFVVHGVYRRPGRRAEGGPVGPLWFVEAEFVPDGWRPPPGWRPSPAMDADAGYREHPVPPLPGVLAQNGVRHFRTDAEGEAYGEVHLSHPERDPGAFGHLPPHQRDAIVAYTRRSSPYNEFLRTPEGERPALLRDWMGRGGDAWELYVLAGGRTPTMEDVLAAAARMDTLPPVLRSVVEEITAAPDPGAELAMWRGWAGLPGYLVDLFGRLPTLADLHARIGVLDAAIGSSPLPEAIVTHRGLSRADFLTGFTDDPGTLVGTVQHEPGYLSTSLGAGVFGYAGGYVDPVQIHFTLPPGTRALWVGRNSRFPTQRELILARDTDYLITAVQRRPDGTLDIFAEVLPPSPPVPTATGGGGAVAFPGTDTGTDEGGRAHG
ncbi:ADP-ribosyltransferase [Nocardiopsis sp. YSL2]|uniref:ADP-ribosyltransferase n=1 Tax=Nocardiopsis sp. YSL2 TaxID=2939492 RepID=UPI0026F43644|nr:ADP-ribosyltransferase [Nocardiopsis sp. YSL2]